MRDFVHYRGVIIWRNTRPGYALRWSATGYGAADTLAEMKALIREQAQAREVRQMQAREVRQMQRQH